MAAPGASRAWTTGASLDATDYYVFTVTPSTPTDLTTLAYTDRRSATGPTTFEVRYSTDGFATSTLIGAA